MPTYESAPGGTSVITVNAPGSANTKGSFTDLTASTTIAAEGFYVIAYGGNSNLKSYLFDIAVGAVGFETVIVPNLAMQIPNIGYSQQAWSVYIPIPVVSGTRISARAQCSSASNGVFLGLLLVKDGDVFTTPLTSVVAAAYGVNTTTSSTTQIDPGGSANTKGSYVQLTAATSTTNPIKLLLVQFMPGSNVARTDCRWAVDIATGAASSETVIVPDIGMSTNSQGHAISPSIYSVPVSIPSGTRIAARAACNITDAVDRLFNISVIGFEGKTTAAGASFMVVT